MYLHINIYFLFLLILQDNEHIEQVCMEAYEFTI